MRLFISGGAGFVGAHLCRQALTAGHQVLNFDALTPAASVSEIWDLQENPNYTLIHGNLRDEPTLDRMIQDFRPDAVIDLAIPSDVAESVLAPERAVDTVHMRHDILQTSLRYWQENRGYFRLVSLGGCLSDHGLYSPHAAGKTGAEAMTMAAWQTHGLPVVFADCGPAYGPRQPITGDLAHLILSAYHQHPLRISGDDQDEGWLHVTDLAKGILWCAEHGTAGTHYPIKPDQGLPRKMLVRQLCRLLQIKAPQNGLRYSDLVTLHGETPPSAPHLEWQNVIRGRADWQAQISIETGLAQTVDWYLNNQSWWNAAWEKYHVTPQRPTIFTKQEVAA